MAPEQIQTPKPEPAETTVVRKWRPLRWLLAFVVLCFGAVAVGLSQLPGRSLSMPVWLQERVESRIAEAYPNLNIRFRSVMLVIGEQWHPSIALQDVELRDTDQSHLLSFPDVGVSLSPEALLSGRISLKAVRMSGAFVTLRRDAEGHFNVAMDRTRKTGTPKTRTLTSLLAAVDSALQRPALAEFDEFLLTNLTMRYEDNRVARNWNVDGGRLQLQRVGDTLQLGADFTVLGTRTYASRIAVNATSIIGSSAIDLGVSFDDMVAADLALQSPALSWLGVLEAPISGAVRTGFNTEGVLQPLNASLQIGAGVLQPNANTQPIPFDSASSYFSFDPASRRLTFDTISLQSDLVTTTASGQAILLGEGQGLPDGLLGQFELSDVAAKPYLNLATEVALDQVTMDFKLMFDPLKVNLGRLLITLPEGEIAVDGAATAEPDGWRWALNLTSGSATPEHILRYWPSDLKSKLRRWIAANILDGALSDINLYLRSAPNQNLRTHLGFLFRDARVKFLKTLPPLQDAVGYVTLTDARLVAGIEAGWVKAAQGGMIDTAGTTFVIPDTRIKPAPAEVGLIANSSLTAALSILDEPPFRFVSKSKLRTQTMQGQAEVSAKFNFVLKKKLPPKQVLFEATGKITDFSSTAIIRDHRLSAEKISLFLDPKGLRLSGAGLLDTVPFEGRWQMPFGAAGKAGAKVTASVELSQTLLENFAISLPPGVMTGSGSADINIALPKGALPVLQFKSDLTGIGLNIPQIGWRKAAEKSGNLAFSATLSKPIALSEIQFQAPGLQGSAALGLTPQGKFERADFKALKIGNWLDAPVSLIGRGVAQPPEILVNGGVLDLRKLPRGGAGKGRNGPISVSLKRLKVTRGIALHNFKAKFGAGNGLKGAFSGLVNGAASVRGQITPQNGRSRVSLRSKNAGGVLEAAGFFRKASGGDLALSLNPVGAAGTFDGVLKVTNTRLIDAPVVAELLNFISVVGLLEKLGKSGILFTEVDAAFRLTPKQLILSKSSAIGPSIGVSLDGYYNLAERVMDMQGVVSPIYLLNGIASIIGRKGEGLIGFSFNLKGKSDKPRILVNPLSALTPGMFREIFRRPAPKLKN